MNDCVSNPTVKRIPFTKDHGNGHRARLGLIVLESDQSIEDEFRLLTQVEGVSVYHSRIQNETIITPDSLSKMKEQLPIAAKLFPPYLNLKVIGYGCTSGSTIIGETIVADMIGKVHPNVPVTNPLTAAKVALRTLNINCIGLVTPYSPTVTKSMEINFKDAGFDVREVGSFFEEDDKIVGKIDQNSILDATIEIGENHLCDGVFISCTNLRASPIIEKAEAILNKPVTASNHALAWHMMRLAGINDDVTGLGKLFGLQIKNDLS